ncbi:MAG: hypothetical protein DCC65_02485 [Planctomycetota bacterium]|nr:MAG: hypothetical protein DCC65_02485 [Planctomycetota bacterium]
MKPNPGKPGTHASIAQTPFLLESRASENGVIIARMSGSCTMEVAESVCRQVLDLVSRAERVLIVDMSNLDFIESMGLGGLVAGYLRARKQGREVRLCAPQPAIRELLEMTRLTLLFRVFDSVAEAQASEQ